MIQPPPTPHSVGRVVASRPGINSREQMSDNQIEIVSDIEPRFLRLRSGCSAGLFLGLTTIIGTANETADSGPIFRDTSFEELASVSIVTASRRPEPYFTTPSAVHVIHGNEIERFGGRSIPEALRLAPGVHVARMNSHRYAVSIRGFSDEFSNKLLVMRDGRSLYTPQFSGTFWDVQGAFMDDIAQIEIVRGPGGAAWGANAVNGVVNIITKPADETQGLLVTGGGGSEETAFGGVRYGGRIGELSYYRVYGQAFERGSTKFADGSDANDDWWQALGGFRIDRKTDNGGNRLKLSGEFYNGEENQIIFSGEDVIDVQGGHIIGGWEHDFEADSTLKLQMYYDAYHRDSGQGESDGDQFNVSLDHNVALGDSHFLTWGSEYRAHHDSLSTPPELIYEPDSRTLQFFSVYAQDEWAIVDPLRLTVGAKLEHNDYTGWEPLPQRPARLAPERTPDRVGGCRACDPRAFPLRRQPYRFDPRIRVHVVAKHGPASGKTLGLRTWIQDPAARLSVSGRGRLLERLRRPANIRTRSLIHSDQHGSDPGFHDGRFNLRWRDQPALAGA